VTSKVKGKIPTGGVDKSLEGDPVRDRILGAAFKAFTENGYAATSTLEIATQAKVSKRELYALFGSKQAMLVACIAGRASRMRPLPDLPPPRRRDKLAAALTDFGAVLMREVCHPTVIATFRLAIAEAERSPEVAQSLQTFGRDPARVALARLMGNAQAAGLLGGGDAAGMAKQYLALLLEDTVLTLLLGVGDAPSHNEIRRRASRATAAFLQLHPTPSALAS